MGKKRSKSQRIGIAGEDYFRLFSGRHRLLPNKVEQDFGTDFLCQLEDALNETGSAAVMGGVVGAFVRTTTNSRGRLHLARSDVEHLLSCDYPIFIFLVHLRKDGKPDLYYRFLDGEFAEMLADFLVSNSRHLSLTPSRMKDEALFDTDLSHALKQGFLEQIRIRLAAKKLNHVIPHARIQINRTENGSFTLIKIRDFYSQFDPTARGSLHNAIFGHERLITQRLGGLPIRQEIIDSLRHLPSPIVIAATVSSGFDTIEVLSRNHTSTTCTFEHRKSSDHIGWVHKSGFAITVSESSLYEGKWVHWLRVHVDPDFPVVLPQHEDLWLFLEACEPGAKVKLWKDVDAYDVKLFGGLVQYGFFARYLRHVSKLYPWPDGAWHLDDAGCSELLNTLAFLYYLDKAPEKMKGLGFIFSDVKAEESPTMAWVPVCMNLREHGLIVWIHSNGSLLKHKGRSIGFRFGEILKVEIDLREERFAKSQWPEIVVAPDIGTVSLGPLTEETTQHSSDPSPWDCSIILELP